MSIETALDAVEWHEEPPPCDCDDNIGIPWVTHSGTLIVGPLSLRVYQLSDGNRIIDAEDFERFFSTMEGK